MTALLLSFLASLGHLALLLLTPAGLMAAFIGGVFVAMLLALALYHRMAMHVVEKADQDVTVAEEGPSNVYYLTPAALGPRP